MATRKSATAIVTEEHREPIGKDVETSLRSGGHITPEAIALALLGTAEDRKLETSKLMVIRNLLKASSPKEIDLALRSATKDEKKDVDGNKPAKGVKTDPDNPVNYGPLIVSLCRKGMALKSAKVRASEMRTIADAFTHGMEINPKRGWNNTVIDAQAKRKEIKANELKAASDSLGTTLIAEALQKGIRGDEAQLNYRDKRLAELQAETDAVEGTKKRDREVIRVVELGKDMAIDVCTRVLGTFGYSVHVTPKATKAKAKAKSPVVKAKMPSDAHAATEFITQ